HARSFYYSLKHPVLLGRLFASPHWIQLFGDQVVGTIEPPDLESMYANISCPMLLACPLVIDAALQIAGSWDGYRNGYVSVPVGIETILLGRRPHPNERTRALARVVRLEPPEVFYHVTIVGENSEVIAQLYNVHLKRLGGPSVTP
ncbi:MAG TPA: polyketide synthase dehydratase domain-containing protein, partial [Polyangiaceae bacterium]